MGETISRLRVRYVETDQMGVAHHSAFLAWMEVARTEYLRSHGVSYRALEEQGYRMPVLSLSIRYFAPARYDDELRLTARLLESNGVRFKFEYKIAREPDGLLLSSCRSEHAVTGPDGRPKRLPPELLSIIGDGSEEP